MLRLALIHGCESAVAQYAEAVRRVRDLKITAIVQSDDTLRQRMTQSLGLACSAASLDELLSGHAAEFDAVLIRGSVMKRADLACQAAHAGKHVFLTSPAAATESDLDRMATACHEAGVTLMIGSRRRFEPAMMAVKSAAMSGQLGSPALLRLQQWLPQEIASDDADPKAVHRPFGKIWSELVTHLDLVRWIFDRAPTDLFVQGRPTPTENLSWPDYLQIHLGFSDGGMALLSLSFGLPVGDSYEMCSLIGSTGAAYSDAHHQMQLKFLGDAPRAVQGVNDIPTKAAQLRAFVEAIGNENSSKFAVAEMKLALRLTQAAWTSYVDHRPVKLSGGSHVDS